MADRYWVGVTNQNWNNTGNWSATSGGGSGASFPVGGDNVFFDANSNLAVNKNVNINVASACQRLDFKAYTGAVTMSNVLTVGSNALNITGSIELGSGMSIVGSSALVTRTNTWFQFIPNGKHWPNALSLNGSYLAANSRLIISGSDLTVSGTLTLHSTQTNASDLSIYSGGSGGPFNIIVSGSFIDNCDINDDIISFGPKLIFKGPGSWSSTNTTNHSLYMDVDIDTGPSTLNIGTATHGGNLTYLSGTVNCTETYIARGTNTTYTLSTSGSTSPLATTSSNSGINFNNIQFRSFSNGVPVYSLPNPMCVVGTLSTRDQNGTITALNAYMYIMTGSVYLNGNLDQGIRRLEGTSKLIFQSPTTGIWSDPGLDTRVTITGRIGVGMDIDIACSGSLIITGSVAYGGLSYPSTLRYVTGSVITSGSTLVLGTASNTTIISCSNVIWNNLHIGIPSQIHSVGVTFSGDHTFTGSFVYTSSLSSDVNINGSNISFGRDISLPTLTTQNILGTATFVTTGPGTMSMNPAVTSGSFRNNLVFNNGANTFRVSGSFRYQTGNITYTSGIIDTSTFLSNLILPAASSFNTDGMAWYNITIPTSATHTLNSKLTVNNLLNIQGVTTTFTGSGGFDVLGLTATLPAASRVITLDDAATDYVVRGALNMSTTSAIRYTLTSEDSANRAYFTLSSSATNNITNEFVNATRIDSSRGQTVLARSASLNDTINWSLGRTIPQSFILD
jgi:hypothetical protein